MEKPINNNVLRQALAPREKPALPSNFAYTTTVSWLRKKRIKYLSIEDRPNLSDEEVDEVLDNESRLDELRNAIALLRPDEQMLLELYYFESRPMADIAYILDVEPGTIATRLHRIRRKLYSMISRK